MVVQGLHDREAEDWLRDYDGDYLYNLVYNLPSASRVVEIGCWGGRSLTVMLVACRDSDSSEKKTVCTIDDFSSDGSMDCPTTPGSSRQVSCASEVNDRVNRNNLSNWFSGLHVMKSKDWFKIHDESDRYDMFFIDGCHPIVAFDVSEAWKRLNFEGLIVAHDYDPSHLQIVHDIDSLNLPGAACGHGTSLWMVKKPCQDLSERVSD